MNKDAIFICAHNEPSIATTIDGVRKALPDCLIFVVDDGSTDNTAALAVEAGAGLLINFRGSEYGDGFRRALRYAIARPYIHKIGFIDAGGSYDPWYFRAMFRLLDSHDVVQGTRFRKYNSIIGGGPIRALLTTIGHRVFAAAAGKDDADYCSMRTFSRHGMIIAEEIAFQCPVQAHSFNPCFSYRLFKSHARVALQTSEYRRTNSQINPRRAFNAALSFANTVWRCR